MIIRTVFLILLGTFVVGAVSGSYAAESMGIVAVVNETAISQRDVEERMKMALASSGLPNSKDMQARVLPQVLGSLIEDAIKLQEAGRQKIEISEEDVSEGLNSIAQQNQMSLEDFSKVMQQQGIAVAILKDQIRAQIAWTRVVQQVLRPKVTVSPNDVVARTKRLKAQIGKPEYLVAEIFLPVDEDEADVRRLADRLMIELREQKAPFGAVAAQFSKAAGAENGGFLGWIQPGQLEPELDAVLPKLEEGQVSNPIKTQAGYHLMMVQQKRLLTEETFPSEEDITNQVGLERLDRLQQHYLLDLKSAAFIETRL